MRKYFFSFAMLAAVLSAVIGVCGSCNTGSADAKALPFDSIVVDTVVTVGDVENPPACKIKMSLLFAEGPLADVVNDSIAHSDIFRGSFGKVVKRDQKISLREAVKTFVDSCIVRHRRLAEPILEAGFNTPVLTYTHEVKSVVSYNRPGVATCIFYVRYGLGSDFEVGEYVFNFDTTTGRKIQKSDIISAVPDSVAVAKIVDGVIAEKGVKEFMDLRMQGIFLAVEPFVPNNFIMEKDSVTFVFQPKEAAYSGNGIIRGTVAYSDLGLDKPAE